MKLQRWDSLFAMKNSKSEKHGDCGGSFDIVFIDCLLLYHALCFMMVSFDTISLASQ